MSQTTEQPPTVAPPAPATTPRRPRRRSGGRRTRVVIRQVAPLSVLKTSLIFYFCVWLIVFLALVIIYMLMSAVGAIDSLEKLLGLFFSPPGEDISTRGATPIEINEGVVFTWLFFGGTAMTVIWALLNVLAAFLYNLISDVVGGVEVTLAERRPR
jgi:hypothetical protein